MKLIKKNVLFAVTTTILMMIFLFFFSLNVHSQNRNQVSNSTKQEIDMIEREYLKIVRNTMDDYGCKFSGVTMTKIYEADGSRNYEVEIHHQNLAYFDESEMNMIETELNQTLNVDASADFSFIFNS